MLHQRSIALGVLEAASLFLLQCGSSNSRSGTTTTGTGGTGTGTSNPGGTGGGSGGGSTVPGYGEGTGAAGQTAAARLLYAIVAPSGAPDGLMLQSDGTLTGQTGATMSSGGGQTMAIGPSGTLLYETAVTAPVTSGPAIPGGVWAFVIDPTTGSLTTGSGSPYHPDLNFYSDVVDQ